MLGNLARLSYTLKFMPSHRAPAQRCLSLFPCRMCELTAAATIQRCQFQLSVSDGLDTAQYAFTRGWSIPRVEWYLNPNQIFASPLHLLVLSEK